MKTNLLLITCLILVGCGRQEESQLGKSEAIKSESVNNRVDTVRWAFANKREIDSAIFKWSQKQTEDLNTSEALSPEIEEKIRQYQILQSELARKQMDKRMAAMGVRLPQRAIPPLEALASAGANVTNPIIAIPQKATPLEASAFDKDDEALSKRVAEAKAPIADILDRRKCQAAKYRDKYSTDKLIAEYVKDRFDLIVDSSDERNSRTAVLYRKTSEVLDITDGIIKLFQEKAKP